MQYVGKYVGALCLELATPIAMHHREQEEDIKR
jgi:hypothetical protein